MEQNIESAEYRIAEYRIARYRVCIIWNRKISNTLNIDGKNIESKISKGQNIEKAEWPSTTYRSVKISKAIYREDTISKDEILKRQNNGKAKHRNLN